MNKSSLASKLTSMLDAPESVKNEVFSLLIKKLVQRLQPGDSIVLSDLGTFHFKKVIIKKPYSTDVNISSSINVIGYELKNDKYLLYEFPASIEIDDEFVNDLAHLMNQTGSAAGSFDIETAKMYIQTYEEIVDDIIQSGQLNKNKVIGSEFLIISREDFEKSLEGNNEELKNEPPSINPKSSFADFLNESMDEEFSDIDMEEEIQDNSKDDPFNKVIDDVELSFDEIDFEKVSPFEVDEKPIEDNRFNNETLNISDKPDFNTPLDDNEIEEIEIHSDEFEIQPEISADLEQAEPLIEKNDLSISSFDEVIEKDINTKQEILEKDYKKRKSNALFYAIAGVLAIAAIGLFIYYQLGHKLMGNKNASSNNDVVKTTEINRNDQIPVTIDEQLKSEETTTEVPADPTPVSSPAVEEKKVETPQNNIVKQEAATKTEVKTTAKTENKAVSKPPVQTKTVNATANVKKSVVKKPVNQEPTSDSRVTTRRSDGFEQVSSWQDLNKASNQVVTERSKGYESKIEVIEIAGKGTWYRVLRRKL